MPQKGLVAWLERVYSAQWAFPLSDSLGSGQEWNLPDNARVAVVGGGVAGLAMVRRLLCLAAARSRQLHVTLLQARHCGYCGGLVTARARESLRQGLAWEWPREVPYLEIKAGVYLNPQGSFSFPLQPAPWAVPRSSNFGYQGLEDALRSRLREGLPGAEQHLEMISSAAVTRMARLPGGQLQVSYRQGGSSRCLEADVVVLAPGLRGLHSSLIGGLEEQFGFRPPRVMDAGVAQVEVGGARHNELGQRVAVLDGILPGVTISLIPQPGQRLTVISLNGFLEPAQLARVFQHPRVKEVLDLPRVEENLCCRGGCRARVFTSPARGCHGEGWLTVGDLTGYGRVLKDGYWSASVAAHRAATVVVEKGVSKSALRRWYLPFLVREGRGGGLGMQLFHLNRRLVAFSWYCRWLAASGQQEKTGGLVQSAWQGMTTGDLPYPWVMVLMVLGLLRWLFFRPLAWLADWSGRYRLATRQ